MDDQKLETQAARDHEEMQDPESCRPIDQDQDTSRTIKYMDDDTFRRSLNKVVKVHKRLLAKLAE